jgi:hypothetical protein
VVTNKEFLPESIITVTKDFVSMETSNKISRTVYYKWHWKENLERRLSAIYKLCLAV